MGHIVIRDLDDSVIARLEERAQASGATLEDVVRDILSEAARPSRDDAIARADQIRQRIRARAGGDVPLDATAMIREDRDSR